MRELPAGTMVDDRYRIVTRLGSGGMADVYCAEDNQLGRRVALKILYGRFAADDEFVERFRREASHAAGLQHQHVVSVYDRGEWDSTSYIAMEYVDGPTLKQIIQREAPLEPLRAIDLTIQILRAVRFAHRRGVIHRDLKPHNVMVDVEDRAKVTDFGIARAGASDMTQTGSIMGTAQYLSPEQAQGQAVDETSDLYSVGIVLYEMLTGQVPFEGESPVAIALKQVNAPPPPPSAANPAVPAVLEDVILHALAKAPADRYPDADAFIAALEDARQEIVAGVAPSRQDTATFAAPVVAPAADDLWGTMPEHALEDEPPRERDTRPWWIAAAGVLLVAAIVAIVLLVSGGKQVEVPSVVGKTQTAATTQLEDDGLEVTAETVIDDSAKRGTVVRQSPQAGAKVDEGTVVRLSVSSGPGDVQVPLVDGMGRLEARRLLEQQGFDVQPDKSEPSDTVAQFKVIRTIPENGDQIAANGKITLVVSSGPELVAVPPVVDLDEQTATTTLEDAGFEVDPIDQKTAMAAPGTVLAQSPTASSTAPKGSTVQITVARESETVTVPDVTGETADDATQILRDRGLNPVRAFEDIPSADGDGAVIRQSPEANATKRVPRGSDVTITVGRFAGTTTPTAP